MTFHRKEHGPWQHDLPREDPFEPGWPADPAEFRLTRAEAAREALAQIAAGWNGTYPYGDVLALIDALDPRALQAPPRPLRPYAWLGRMLRRLGGFLLTRAGRAHRMKRTIGEGCRGDGRSPAPGLSLRGVPSRP